MRVVFQMGVRFSYSRRINSAKNELPNAPGLRLHGESVGNVYVLRGFE